MATFTVWSFDTPTGAAQALDILRGAQSDGLTTIVDHAIVTWAPDAQIPTTTHGAEDVWRGTGWGAFWGFVVGTIFFAPLIGSAAGAALGGMTKAAEDAGIDSEQIDKIRATVTPGTSALFVVTEDGDPDLVGERFHGVHATLLATNLTDAERSELLATFGS